MIGICVQSSIFSPYSDKSLETDLLRLYRVEQQQDAIKTLQNTLNSLHRVEDQLNSWLTALLPVPTTTPHVDQ
jgi:hypothetical protein